MADLKYSGFQLSLILWLILSFLSCSQNPDIASYYEDKVSTATPEATKTGLEILNKGGNAIDAAIAISFVLAVTEPAMSGLGGGTQVLVHIPGRSVFSINGTTLSPSDIPSQVSEDDLEYHRRSTVPSTVKILEYCWKNYGSGVISWKDLLKPAIHYAEAGFEVGLFRHKVYKRYEDALKASPYSTYLFLKPDGSIPGQGEILQQDVLAGTLKKIAENGADEFYKGSIADEIAKDMQKNGGWITTADLMNFPDPKEQESLHTSYRNYDVYSQPPPCGGWSVLFSLNMLEQFPAEQLSTYSDKRREIVSNVLRISHAERKNNPIKEINNFLPEIKKKLDKSYAKKLLQTPIHSENGLELENRGGETTHFSVMDKSGIAVSVTSSINAYFGAKAASPELGFLYNSYMDDFVLNDLNHPFLLRPNSAAYSSMSPSIVMEGNKIKMIIGSPGSARIISTVSQLIQLFIDGTFSMQQIVELPRFHIIDNRIYVENFPVNTESQTYYMKSGLEIFSPNSLLSINGLNAYFGGVHAIGFKNGSWESVADPRRDGLAN